MRTETKRHVLPPASISITSPAGKIDICRQCSSRSTCAFVQSDLRVILSANKVNKSRSLFYSYAGNVALGQYFENAQSDLKLHYPLMAYGNSFVDRIMF